MKEDWKACPDYPYLAFSNKGRIFNLETQHYLKIRLNKGVMPCISVWDIKNKRSKPLYVGKVFASLFLEDTPKNYVIYKDNNHLNLAADNLIWSDRQNPHRHHFINPSKHNGRYSRRIRCVETGEVFPSAKQLAKDLDYSTNTIYHSIYRKTKILSLGLSFEYVDELETL